MADEITITAKLTVNKNGSSVSNNTSGLTQTMESTLSHMVDKVIQITNSAADLPLTELDMDPNEYYVLLYNPSATATVTVAVRKDGTPTDTNVGVIRPGEFWGPARMPAQSGGYPKLRVVSNTATQDLEVVACEAGDPAV